MNTKNRRYQSCRTCTVCVIRLSSALRNFYFSLDRRNFITFVWMVLAAILSQSVALCSWDVALPFNVNAASTIRRFSRWLHNPKIDTRRIYDAITRNAFQNWTGDRIILAMDTTMLRDKVYAVRVSMIYLGRAIPIAWSVLEHNSSSVKFADYKGVLTQARSRLPANVGVLFLADRGFVCKKLMRQLNEWGWIWRIRVKNNQVLHCKDKRMTPKMLMLPKGNAMLFSGIICFGRNLESLSLSAGWSRGADEPWYILSKLVDLERYEVGRNPLPSMLIVDSKSVQNADTANEKGYDGWNIAILAQSLLSLFKHNFLPKECQKSRPKTLRFKFFVTLGRIVSHARRTVLKIQAGRVAQWFMYVRDRLMIFCAAME